MELLVLIPEARALLDPDDRQHRRLLDFPVVALEEMQGDDTAMRALIDEALPTATTCVLAAAGASSFVSVRIGHFD